LQLNLAQKANILFVYNYLRRTFAIQIFKQYGKIRITLNKL